jgi:hypothetical protein
MSNSILPDEKFKERWGASHVAIGDIATEFCTRGRIVRIPPQRLRPDVAVALDFADGGDLLVEWAIEVRQQLTSGDWTDKASFKYPTVFFDSPHLCTLAKWRRTLGYCVVNAARTWYIFVPRESAPHWREEPFYDRVYQCERRAVAVPIEHVSFHRMGGARLEASPWGPFDHPPRE